jgi:hypothetical protein
MEQSCSRCRETIQDGYRYCPGCGLPRFVYSSEGCADTAPRDGWDEAMRDGNIVDWRAASRSILPPAIAAGILCSLVSPVGLLGLLLMGAAAAWAVTLYSRPRLPAQSQVWITVRAGARIGLVCGLLAGALAFAVSGCELYAKRYVLHQGSQIDGDWKQFVQLDAQFSQRIAGWAGVSDSAEAQAEAAQQASWMLSPQGHAGYVVASLALASFLLVLFAMAGGALGARRLTRGVRRSST